MAKEALLELKNVTFSYDPPGRGEPVLKGLSLTVREGEFLTLIGPSGSGKSTIFKLITGLLEPQEGELFYRGQPFHQRLGRVAYMPQQDLLFPWRTVLQNAVLALEVKGVKREEAFARAQKHLQAFGLEAVAHKYPHQLSGGMRQRVAFLRTVLAESELLLLDEPFGALDSLTRSQMQGWLLSLWQHLKATVLFITHDVEEAILLSDRVCVLSPRPIREALLVENPLPRPRSPEMVTDEAFVEMKRLLLTHVSQWR